VLSVSISEADAAWLDQLKAAAAALGLAIASQEDKEANGIQLSVRSLDKEGQRGQ